MKQFSLSHAQKCQSVGSAKKPIQLLGTAMFVSSCYIQDTL